MRPGPPGDDCDQLSTDQVCHWLIGKSSSGETPAPTIAACGVPLQSDASGLRKCGVVESAWGAVSGLLPVRFPRPLAEPAVPVSRQRALHGFCRSGVVESLVGVGDLDTAVDVPGDRHRGDVEQFDPAHRGSGPAAGAAAEPAVHVVPLPAM
jgi:hypothetical protein